MPAVPLWSADAMAQQTKLIIYLQDDKKNQYLLIVPLSPWLAELASAVRCLQTCYHKVTGDDETISPKD